MYRSNSHRFPSPQELHKKDGIKFWVYHLHNGSDPDWSEREKHAVGRYVPPYVTVCEITAKDNDNHIVARGVAVCNPHDQPNRKLGHEIAVTRAIKAYVENP